MITAGKLHATTIGAALIATMTLLPTNVTLASPAEFMVYGSGNSSCGAWIASRRDDGGSYQKMAWIQGFVTATGLWNKMELQKTDVDAMAAFLDNYCEDNPLTSISTASMALTLVLMVQHEKGSP